MPHIEKDYFGNVRSQLSKTILIDAIFDYPDANMLNIDKDYFGNPRSQYLIVGP